MPTYSKTRALAAAMAASQAASQVLMSRFQTWERPGRRRVALQTWMKSPGALVTDADVASDREIAKALRECGAPGRILSEESQSSEQRLTGDGASGPSESRGGRRGSRYGALTWLIDPLCGTYPYSTGMVHWGVNVALRRDAGLELGVVAVPALGETLSAVRGKGVKRNGRRWAPDVRAEIAPPSDAAAPGDTASGEASRVPAGRGASSARTDPFAGREISGSAIGLEIDGGDMWRKLMRDGLEWVTKCGEINTFASIAYPITQVCLGRLAGMVIYGVEPVHIAAGAAIAIELGLNVTDRKGTPIDWSQDGELPAVVVAWPSIHGQLMSAMR